MKFIIDSHLNLEIKYLQVKSMLSEQIGSCFEVILVCGFHIFQH